MSDEPLIQVAGVGKRFCRSLKRSLWYGVRDIVSEFSPFRNGRAPSTALRGYEFWALNGVTFEVRRGECLGLIGRNGAGKTTLLKVLNGLIKPDLGRVTLRGRVGALIALGAGFNPVLSGRENIYVNGSILGLTKREIDGKIEEIIDFSEIREFIDAPVQSYSSGMAVRLGFAVASSLSPDVLLVDEVLAVGDLSFRAKCFRRIDELRRNAAVVLVSHQMDQIGVACNRVVVMDRGTVVCDGAPDAGIQAYERLNENRNVEGDAEVRRITPPLTSVDLEIPAQFSYGETFRAVLNICSADAIPDFYMRVRLRGPDATLALDITSLGTPIHLPAGKHRLEITSECLFLRSGTYVVSADGFCVSQLEPLFYLSRLYRTRVVGAIRFRGDGYTNLPATLRFNGVSADCTAQPLGSPA